MKYLWNTIPYVKNVSYHLSVVTRERALSSAALLMTIYPLSARQQTSQDKNFAPTLQLNNNTIEFNPYTMKINIHIGEINEVLEARDAGDSLSKLKAETANRAPFLLRSVIKSLSDLQFAQEAVKRDNAANARNDVLPQNAEEFLAWAVMRGYASVEDS